MKTLKLVSLFAALCVLAANVHTAKAQTSALHRVNKIFVEDMGGSPEAQRFRLVLEDELSKRSFQVVNERADADAVLSGVVSVADGDLYGGHRDIGVTVRLTTASGARLWSGNFGGQAYVVNPIQAIKFNEPISYRAKELAKKLRGDWNKSAKR